MTDTIKIYPADLNVFFQDEKHTAETIQQQKDIMQSIIDGAEILEDAVVDSALAALLSSTYDIQSYNRSMAAYKKIREEHPKHDLGGDLAGSIQYNLKYGKNKKAKAYMLLSHKFHYEDNLQDVNAKWELLDTLNDISGNDKLDSNLRMRAMLAGYTQTLNESDEVISAVIRPFNKVVTETCDAPFDVTCRLAKMINDPEADVSAEWTNKPKTVTEAAFLLTFQSNKMDYFIEEGPDGEGKESLKEEKVLVDAALDKLKFANPKGYKWGEALGKDRYASYRLRNSIAEWAAETGTQITQFNFPGGRVYAWGNKPEVA